MEVLHRGLGDQKYAPCPLLRQYVQAGRLGRKSGRGFYEYSAAFRGVSDRPDRGIKQSPSSFRYMPCGEGGSPQMKILLVDDEPR